MCSPFYYTISDLEKAFALGYERGHSDTTRDRFLGGEYTECTEDVAEEAIEEAIRDKVFETWKWE